MKQYEDLFNTLIKRKEEKNITFSFFDMSFLPIEAKNSEKWWRNTRQHPQADAWLDAGYLVSDIDLKHENVEFSKIANSNLFNTILDVGKIYVGFKYFKFGVLVILDSVKKYNKKSSICFFLETNREDVIVDEVLDYIKGYNSFKKYLFIDVKYKEKCNSINHEINIWGIDLQKNSESYVYDLVFDTLENEPRVQTCMQERKVKIDFQAGYVLIQLGSKKFDVYVQEQIERNNLQERKDHYSILIDYGIKKDIDKKNVDFVITANELSVNNWIKKSKILKIFYIVDYDFYLGKLNDKIKIISDYDNCTLQFFQTIPKAAENKFIEFERNRLNGQGFLSTGFIDITRLGLSTNKLKDNYKSTIESYLQCFYVDTFSKAILFWFKDSSVRKYLSNRKKYSYYEFILSKWKEFFFPNISPGRLNNLLNLLLNPIYLKIDELYGWIKWESGKNELNTKEKVLDLEKEIYSLLRKNDLCLRVYDDLQDELFIHQIKVIISLVFFQYEIEYIKNNLILKNRIVTWKRVDLKDESSLSFYRDLNTSIHKFLYTDLNFYEDSLIVENRQKNISILEYYLQYYKNSIDLVVPIRSIRDVETYLDANRIKYKDYSLFFRGQLAKYDLGTAIYRNEGYLENENKLAANAYLRLPQEFKRFSSEIEKLIHLKHYNMASRYIDIAFTYSYPLAFAVSIEDFYGKYGRKTNESDGVIFIGAIIPGQIKTTMNDTVSLLSAISYASFQKLNDPHKDRIRNYLIDVKNAAHKINSAITQVPMNLGDLDASIVFEPPRANERITNQNGSFIITGINQFFPWLPQKDIAGCFSINGERTILYIPSGCCGSILEELKKLGVNLLSTYPDMTNLRYYIEEDVMKKLVYK